MVLKPLETGGVEDDGLGSLGFLAPFYQRFKTKFVKGLLKSFSGLDYKLAMSILDPKINFTKDDVSLISPKESSFLVKLICPPEDLTLLEAYTNNRKDYGEVEQLLPLLAQFYFQEKLPVTFSHVEASLLLSMGLQLHDITYVQDQMKLEKPQILHIFRKVMVKFYKYFSDVLMKELDPSFPRDRKGELQPHAVSVDEDLIDGARKAMKHNIKGIETTSVHPSLNPEKLLDYSIEGNDEFEQTLQRCSRIPPSGVLSVKSVRNMASKRKRHELSNMKTIKTVPQGEVG